MSERSPHPRSRILVGDDGLRAGWSIALFLSPFVLLLALAWLILGVDVFLNPPQAATQTLTPGAAFVGETLPFVFIAAMAFAMSIIEHRPFARYGLAPQRLLPDLAAGLAWGAATLSLLIAALRLTHAIAFDGIALPAAHAILYAFKWAAAMFSVGLLEEFLFRGYLQFTLARGITGIVRTLAPRNPDAQLIGFVVAAFLLTSLFAWTHLSNGGETLIGILAVALVGAVFAFSLWRTGALWWAIGFHTAWDWAQSYLYGTPDSGNLVQGHLLATHPVGSPLLSGASAGPEGSILVLPTLLLAAFIIHLTLPHRGTPSP